MSAVKTILALVLAVGLVGGALYVRSEFIESDEPVAAPSTGPTAATGSGGGEGDAELAVACDEVLGQACPAGSDALDLAELLDAFTTAPVTYDALVAPLAVVEMIEQSQRSRATFGEDRDVLATSPLVLVTAVARDELVADACGAEITWACAAELLRTGDLRGGFASFDGSTEALTGLGALAGGLFGGSAYSLADLQGTAYVSWVDGVLGQSVRTGDPVSQLILTGGAQNDTAVALEATALPAVRGSTRDNANLAWPTPVAHLPVVAVGVDGADVGDLGERTAQALLDAGWRGPDGAPVADGPPAPPDDDGLPSGGTLFALRERLP
ncbi:hypothetical protein [Euzebya sp.]|uniref:hypothetical protein n=1 Tax=Euzebya sp. TaxID=1971409 RepID=UPI003516D70E